MFSGSVARPLLKVAKIPEKSGIWSCHGMGYPEDAFQMQRWSWSEAGKREVMEVWICASPRAMQAQGRCHLVIIRSQRSSIVSLPLKLEDKLLEGGRLIRAKGSHVRGMRLVVRVSWEFADSARGHQFVRQLAGKMPFPLLIKAV